MSDDDVMSPDELAAEAVRRLEEYWTPERVAAQQELEQFERESWREAHRQMQEKDPKGYQQVERMAREHREYMEQKEKPDEG